MSESLQFHHAKQHSKGWDVITAKAEKGITVIHPFFRQFIQRLLNKEGDYIM
jgi:hypothetical protein